MSGAQQYDSAALERVLVSLLTNGEHDEPAPCQRDRFGDTWHVDLLIPTLCEIEPDAAFLGQMLAYLRDIGLDIEGALRSHVATRPRCPMAGISMISTDTLAAFIDGQPGRYASFQELARSFARRKKDRIHLHAALGELAARGAIRREGHLFFLSELYEWRRGG